jgi:phenylpropionate dioxygenase-like ring-hydroxylating dioxygenase large terminal subunit
MRLPPLSHYSWNSKNVPSTTRCVGSHNPQMHLPSFHWSTITMKKHQDQNGSRANSRTSMSATTDWGRQDDRIITGTDGFKRQQERNALRNEKSRRRRGGYQRRSRRLLEFKQEGKVPLYSEIIFRSCCQFTKLQPYTTFFGIWQILNDGLPNH